MIELKSKEPNLSQATVSVIRRACGDDIPINQTVYNNTADIIRYKNKIMDYLTKNEDILRTLHDPKYSLKDEINGDRFRFRSIFPFMKVPLAKAEVKNYICFDVNVQGFGKMVTNQIIIRLISHDDDMETDWGICRTDLMDLIICESFDWTNIFGMKLEKKSDTFYVTTDGYNYRDIIFESTTSNNLYKSVNQ